MKNKGKFIVISGPSGVGKGTICDILLKDIDLSLEYSISMTTRKKRDNEIEGIHYYFTDKDTFKKKIDKDEFIEYAIYNNEYYGTLKSEVIDKINNGKNIISEIDVNGAKKIKEDFEDAILIYLMAPSMEELKRRLIKRGTESIEEINSRLNIAIYENEQRYMYDYVIVNDILENAVNEIKSIVKNVGNYDRK